MARKCRSVGAFAVTAVITMALGTVAGAAHADDVANEIFAGVNRLRPACAPVSQDALLTAAAQRHADDMLNNRNFSHVGTDGSSPGSRIADTGYSGAGATGEIVFWATGSAATASAALDFWMRSTPHRNIILDCGLTAAGFATARNGTMMTAVGDFAGH